MSSDGGRSRCSRSLGRRGRVGRGRARSKSCGPRLRPATPMPASVGSSSLRVTAHSTGRDPFEMKHTHFFLVSPNGRGRAGLKEGGREGGGKGPARARPGGKRLSVDDSGGHGHEHGRGPPPRSRAASRRRADRPTDQGKGGREAVVERRVIACSADVAKGIDGHKTGRGEGEDGTGGGRSGVEGRGKCAVIRGENIPLNSLEDFLGKR